MVNLSAVTCKCTLGAGILQRKNHLPWPEFEQGYSEFAPGVLTNYVVDDNLLVRASGANSGDPSSNPGQGERFLL